MRHVGDEERRARLARRHAVAPAYRLDDPVAATRRDDGAARDRAGRPSTSRCWPASRRSRWPTWTARSYEDRTLVKQLAMRRTALRLPARPAAGRLGQRLGTGRRRRAAPAGQGGRERRDRRGRRGVARGRASGRAAPPRPTARALDARALRRSCPSWRRGSTWRSAGVRRERRRRARGCSASSARRGRARARPQRRSLADLPAAVDPDGARGWGSGPCPLEAGPGLGRAGRGAGCATFGPGTEADLVWWLGATKGTVRAALADVEAVQVTLDGGDTGWLLPDDLDARARGRAVGGPAAGARPDRRWAGRQRDFYLGPTTRACLFDGNGNAGTTAWWDGPGRRLLGAGRSRGGARRAPRGPRRRRPGALDGRGRAARRLAGRRAGRHGLPVAPRCGAALAALGRASRPVTP